MTTTWQHERVIIELGRRSELPIVVAVHSTALGQAVGGCRLWHYPDWQRALADALRLSEAMTLKCALAGLPHGGGKSVVALPSGLELTPARRRAVFLDLGDLVDSFGGTYGVGEDVGSTDEDMLVARERTPYAYCLPTAQGGIGDPSQPTAVGVHASILAACARVFGTADLGGRHCVVIGLGQVGGKVARLLAADGARLSVTDLDPAKRRLATDLDAAWLEPGEALTAEADVLVPAALGGILTPEVVGTLRCSAIVGPANNQLAEEHVADLLAERGIRWAPDFLVNAGGAIYGTMVDIAGGSHDDAMARIREVGATLGHVFDLADEDDVTPSAAARRLAEERVATAQRSMRDAG